MKDKIGGDLVIRGINNNRKRSLEHNSGIIVNNQLQNSTTTFKRGSRHINYC